MVAQFTGQSVDFEEISNIKDKEFLQKYPLGKLPILETAQGSINSSDAIIRLLSYKSKSLNGLNDFETA